MTRHLLGLGASTLIAGLIKAGVALANHSISWVWALLLGLVIVYGGWLIIDGDIID